MRLEEFYKVWDALKNGWPLDWSLLYPFIFGWVPWNKRTGGGGGVGQEFTVDHFSTGEHKMPTFSATLTNHVLGSGVWDDLIFQNVVIDTHGWWANSPGKDRIIPNRPGAVLVTGYLVFNDSTTSTGTRTAQLHRTAVETFAYLDRTPISGKATRLILVGMTVVNGTNDYIAFSSVQDSGVNLTVSKAYLNMIMPAKT